MVGPEPRPGRQQSVLGQPPCERGYRTERLLRLWNADHFADMPLHTPCPRRARPGCGSNSVGGGGRGAAAGDAAAGPVDRESGGQKGVPALPRLSVCVPLLPLRSLRPPLLVPASHASTLSSRAGQWRAAHPLLAQLLSLSPSPSLAKGSLSVAPEMVAQTPAPAPVPPACPPRAPGCGSTPPLGRSRR